MTEHVKTLGASGADYSTLAAWENDLDDGTNAAVNTSAYLNGETAVLEIMDEAITPGATVTINGGTTVVLAGIIVRAVSGGEAQGYAGTGSRLVKSTSNIFFTVTRNVDFADIEFDANSKNVTRALNCNGSSGQTVNIRRCMHHDHSGATSGDGSLCGTGGSRNHQWVRNIVYDITQTATGGQHAYGFSASNTVQVLIGNVADKITGQNGEAHGFTGFNDGSGRTYANNYGGATSTSGTAASFANDMSAYSSATVQSNASQDTSATGTGAVTSVTASTEFVSTVNTTEDYHLDSGSTNLIDAGYDTTTTGGAHIDVDLRDVDSNGDTWDIGAHEYVAAGGTTPQAVAGVISPSGALTIKLMQHLAGQITPTGAVIKQTRKQFAGNTSPSGAMIKKTAKIIGGQLSLAGGIAKNIFKVLAGVINPAGNATITYFQNAAGEITPTGDVTPINLGTLEKKIRNALRHFIGLFLGRN